MSNSVSEELEIVYKLLNEYKLEEALQKVKNIEQCANLSPEEKLRALSYKIWGYWGLGPTEITSKLTEDLYQKSKEMEMPFFMLDALFFKDWIYFHVDARTLEKFHRNLENHAKLFNSLPQEESVEYLERKAHLLLMKGASALHVDRDLDLSFNFHSSSLKILEKINPNSAFIRWNLVGIAFAYANKGELDLALKYHEMALNQPFTAVRILYILKSTIYWGMGGIYHQKGDLNRALEYHKGNLKIQKSLDWPRNIGVAYLNIIIVLLAQNNLNQARNCLEKFRQFNEENKTPLGPPLYQVTRALILKSSSRMRDRTEAENILKKLVDERVLTHLRMYALIFLCDLYLEEFQLFNQIEILDDILPLIDRLLSISEKSKSYSDLANTKLLQAKLALIQIDMFKARKLLTEAQQIADKHNLHLLAGKISREHDHLLEELKLWESFKKERASVAERLELASIGPVMERLQGRRALEPLESTGQKPVALLILVEGGVLLFSYAFSEEWKHDDSLFGSFLSAFTMFSDEFFSQGLDRAKFGEDTLLLHSFGDFSICYLFKGQTYFAKRKLERFAETLQNEPLIYQTLERFEKASQVVEVKDIPQLKGLLTEIFLN